MNDELEGGQLSVVSCPLFVLRNLDACDVTQKIMRHKQLTPDN